MTHHPAEIEATTEIGELDPPEEIVGRKERLVEGIAATKGKKALLLEGTVVVKGRLESQESLEELEVQSGNRCQGVAVRRKAGPVAVLLWMADYLIPVCFHPVGESLLNLQQPCRHRQQAQEGLARPAMVELDKLAELDAQVEKVFQETVLSVAPGTIQGETGKRQ